MKFNYDSPFSQFITTLSHFIVLNFLYLLTCIPIITIGSATCALYESTLKYADQERGYLLKGYILSLKNNWKKSSFIYLLFLFPILILSYSAFFWSSFESIIGTVLTIFSIVICLFLYVAFLYSEALTARFHSSLKQTVKNALLLTIAHPFFAFILLLLPVTSICLIYLLPFFKVFILFLGFSFLTYCSSFIMLQVFKKYSFHS